MSSLDDHDDLYFPRTKVPEINRMVTDDLNRRGFLGKTSGAALASFFASIGVGQDETAEAPAATPPLLGFPLVPSGDGDEVKVPEGYEKPRVLISWGDPLFPDTPEFRQSADASEQERQFGDNNDGMHLFRIEKSGAKHWVFAVNNEYYNKDYLFVHQGRQLTAEDIRKAQAAMGVSIFEVVEGKRGWRVKRKSPFNRRITANTPMILSGPAAGHVLMRTPLDPVGNRVLGTLNNCANGVTPWGTYLTCEENFNGFFASAGKPRLSERERRYGISESGYKDYDWYRFDSRFDLEANPNEQNRFGWVVEIDPSDPLSTPKKRTALGRFKHENAELVVSRDGRVVVYMGDDESGEFIYRFVSSRRYQEGNSDSNRDLLDEGTLYVAKFDDIEEGKDRGKGRWIPLRAGEEKLVSENGFFDQAEVLIFAREAATLMGGTTMDRPEWVTVDRMSDAVYCTLTNNKSRGSATGAPVNDANPRKGNQYGQIIRWMPADRDHTAETFTWDHFVLAGNPTVHTDPGNPYAGSDNVHRDNLFNSPDGLKIDGKGRLWILTDGDSTNQKDFKGMGNNQMLCADPSSGEIRRFLVGPRGCEVTGITFTPDHTTMFVGIQHPGEPPHESHFPDGGDTIPRSSIVVVRKKDGGVIGT